MIRIADLAFCATVFGALVGLFAPTARALEPARAANVEQKLQQETQHLTASRFERVGDSTIEMIRKNEPAIVPVRLEAGTVYAIVVACGDGCDHVEVALFDPSQNLLHQSPDRSDVVIVTGPPQQSGVHGIALSAPGCREAACAVGLVVLKQAAVSPSPSPAEARAAPVAPQASPSPAQTTRVAPRTAPPAPQAALSSPTSIASAPSNADTQASRLLSELASLGVSVREAISSKEKAAAPVAGPIATEASVAPGRPPGAKETRPDVQAATGAARPASPAAPGSAPGVSQKRAPAADCRAREQQYYAAVRTAGTPATIGPLMSMYQYLQCNCGHPPSPQLPPCPR